MIFYQVKPESDQVRRNPNSFKDCSILVKDELYTIKELNKLGFTLEFTPAFMRTNFQEVNISKKKTYWFFGCRFKSSNDGKN